MSNSKAKQEDKREVTIVVNARPRVVTKDEISFEEIVTLAFDAPPVGESTVYTVTFRKGQGNKPEGTLVPGATVKVKEGMIFNVTATDKS